MATTLVSGGSLALQPLQPMPPVFDARTGAAVPLQTDPSTAAQKTFTQQQLAALPGTYAAQRTSAAGRAVQGLAGMGGYAVDAAGNLTYDASQAGSGQLERQAVQGQRSAANASGTLYSSFTDTGISQALGRLSQTAQGVVNQYADQLAGYLGQASSQASTLYGQWAGLVGQDASFALANPPVGKVAPTLSAEQAYNDPNVTAQVRAQAGLPAAGPQYTGSLAQKYGGIYGAIGADPKQQQNVITSWLKSHYPTSSVPLIRRATTDPAYAASIYNRAVGGTTMR